MTELTSGRTVWTTMDLSVLVPQYTPKFGIDL